MRWRGVLRRAHRDLHASSTCTIVVALGRAAGRHAAHPADPGHRLGLRRGVGRGVRPGDLALRGADRHPRRLPGRLRAGRPARDQLLGRRAALRLAAAVAAGDRGAAAARRGGPRAARCRSARCPSRPRTGSRPSTRWPTRTTRSSSTCARSRSGPPRVDLSQANGDAIAREFERYLRRRGSSPS